MKNILSFFFCILLQNNLYLFKIKTMTKIEIKSTANCNQKLQFVKTIKEFTGWGLKEAKFFADDCWTGISKTINIDDLYKANELGENLRQIGVDVMVHNRKKKIRDVFREMGEIDVELIEEFLSKSYVVCANYKGLKKIIISDIGGNEDQEKIYFLEIGGIFKKTVEFKDLSDFEINGISYDKFYQKYFENSL